MNGAQRRGPRFERQVADFLKRWFPYADRRVRTGAKDTGDIGGVPGWVLEVKAPGAGKPLNLSQALTEAETERQNAGEPWCVAVVNRPRRSVADSYVVMTLDQFARLISQRD